jgi:hypothetical protein
MRRLLLSTLLTALIASPSLAREVDYANEHSQDIGYTNRIAAKRGLAINPCTVSEKAEHATCLSLLADGAEEEMKDAFGKLRATLNAKGTKQLDRSQAEWKGQSSKECLAMTNVQDSDEAGARLGGDWLKEYRKEQCRAIQARARRDMLKSLLP